MSRARNSSGNGEVSVQKVEKIDLVHNLVTKPSVYGGAGRRAKTVTSRPATTADVTVFAGRKINKQQPAASSWLHGGAVTKEYISKYIEDKKRQFNQGDETV
uniref:Uncharacterized protein n=1 Tax=Leersia perrieri TaxID=77586 RepID=A0A0D9WCM0_9ORYZ